MNGIRRRATLTLAGLFIAMLSVVSQAPAASADTTVGQCAGIAAGNCVQATTGTKDFSNHTQWVGWVRSYGFGGACGIVKLEAWSNNFYFSSSTDPNSCNPWREWGAQRWVSSGNGVCGAATYTSGYRSVACISITV